MDYNNSTPCGIPDWDRDTKSDFSFSDLLLISNPPFHFIAYLNNVVSWALPKRAPFWKDMEMGIFLTVPFLGHYEPGEPASGEQSSGVEQDNEKMKVIEYSEFGWF